MLEARAATNIIQDRDTVKKPTTHTKLAPPHDLLRLDNQLCFALYAAKRAIAKTYREQLIHIGLTYPQFLLLVVLWEDDGLTVSEIGERLMLDSGTLTRLIKRLGAMQILKRQRSTIDERQVQVFLTAQGLRIRDEALTARKRVACKMQMSETEILNLRADLMMLVSHLGEGGCLTEAAE